MKDNYFLYVGNAYPHKNVEMLERAAKRAGVRIVYVGKEDFFYKRLGINPKSVSDRELSHLYKGAQALVFPSLMEGFGLPVLEALRAGCPVIASDIPVFHELFGSTLAYFNPHDENSLVTILQHPPSRDRFFTETVQKVIKKFSWRKMAQETLRVYGGN